MQALDHLTHEHALIRRVLERAKLALAPLDRPVLAECLEFFSEFVDRAHARQEEHVLFVELGAWAPDLARGPVQTMQKEHNLLRAYLRAARDSISAGPEQKRRLLESVRHYVELMQDHLHKEDTMLFPMAQIALPPSRDAELLQEMLDTRRQALPDDEHERWAAIAEDGGRAGTLLMRDSVPTDPGVRPDIMDARTLGEGAKKGSGGAAADPTGEFERDEQKGYAMRAGGVLFDQAGHRNIWLHDFGRGLSVQSNQFLIVDDDEAMILDPGGPKVYPDVLAETKLHLADANLRYIFLSHQDPDIGTSLNAWLMDTSADALVSKLWVRFLPHFGIDKLLSERLHALPDEGRWLNLGQRELLILPAHFLHSCGNLQVFDPVSRILFSGDLGAAVGIEESVVRDFDAHRHHLEVFHRRYMGSKKAMRAWAKMVRSLDVETIAPQHGALFQGKEMVGRFLDWCEDFECGIDAYEHLFQIPARSS